MTKASKHLCHQVDNFSTSSLLLGAASCTLYNTTPFLIVFFDSIDIVFSQYCIDGNIVKELRWPPRDLFFPWCSRITQPWACHLGSQGWRLWPLTWQLTKNWHLLVWMRERKREIERQTDLGLPSASPTPGTSVTLKANSLFSLYIQNVWREHETHFPLLFFPICSPLFDQFILSYVTLLNATDLAALRSFV